MKTIAIGIISLYQIILSPIIRQIFGNVCRYSPTCSEYAKISIGRYGFIKGGKMAIHRLLTCQPFYQEQRTKN